MSRSPVASPAVSFTLPLALSHVPLARSSVPFPIAVSSFFDGVATLIPREDMIRTSANPHPALWVILDLGSDVSSWWNEARPPRGRAAHVKDRRCQACAHRGPRCDRRIVAGRDLPKDPGWRDRVLERRRAEHLRVPARGDHRSPGLDAGATRPQGRD